MLLIIAVLRNSSDYNFYSFIYLLLMKNFRSSKNLRALDPSTKEESGLRMKVKVL